MFLRGQIVGKYKILSTIGSGGFGTVFLADDTWIDKKVALKVPHKQNLDFGELLREPRLLASLSHPNIVTVITAEKQDNVFFIVMEYVQGDTLENLIGAKGGLELMTALDYTCQICNAVDHAHKQGVLHRDLKPSNVLVRPDGRVLLVDFGLVAELSDAPTPSEIQADVPAGSPSRLSHQSTDRGLAGTIGFMSPETLPQSVHSQRLFDESVQRRGAEFVPPLAGHVRVLKETLGVAADGVRRCRFLRQGLGRVAADLGRRRADEIGSEHATAQHGSRRRHRQATRTRRELRRPCLSRCKSHGSLSGRTLGWVERRAPSPVAV